MKKSKIVIVTFLFFVLLLLAMILLIIYKRNLINSNYVLPYDKAQVSTIVFYNGFNGKSKKVELDEDISSVFEFFENLHISTKRYNYDMCGTYEYRLTFSMNDGTQHKITFLDSGTPCLIKINEENITVIPGEMEIYDLWESVGTEQK